MIAERKLGSQPDDLKPGRETVIASGFGGLSDLQARLPEDLRSAELEALEGEHPYKDAVAAYFSGDMKALASIRHEQSGGDFRQSIWRAMSKVKPGSTISYKKLAEDAGNQAAIRAAGTVCSQNRLVLLVPCHRIIRSDGKTGEYLYGPKIKEYLLKLEADSL